MNRRFVHPLTLIFAACAAVLVLWLNLNFRVQPFIERTEFSNSQDRLTYQFKSLQYDLYKDKAFGFPRDAYTTTLDRIKDPADPLKPMTPQLKVIGSWNKKAAAVDGAVGVLFILACSLVCEWILRRMANRKKLADVKLAETAPAERLPDRSATVDSL